MKFDLFHANHKILSNVYLYIYFYFFFSLVFFTYYGIKLMSVICIIYIFYRYWDPGFNLYLSYFW